MDALDVVLAVEQGKAEDWDAVLEGIREHKESLRRLQGSWGRLISQLESEGVI